MAALIIQFGKKRGQRLALPEGELVVGRGEECRLRLSSAGVSRRHCVLRESADGLTVQDLGSSNGTFVNDVPAPAEEEVRLATGDVLRVGPFEFEVTDVTPARQQRSEIPSEQPSDDEIAAWLGSDTESLSGPDTTIIPQPRTAAAAHGPAAESPSGEHLVARRPSPAPHVSLGPRKRFASLAEEAADVIRRYKEQVAARQPEK